MGKRDNYWVQSDKRDITTTAGSATTPVLEDVRCTCVGLEHVRYIVGGQKIINHLYCERVFIWGFECCFFL